MRGVGGGGILNKTPLKITRNSKSRKFAFFYSKRALSLAKTEVLHEKLKTVLPMGILKFLISSPNFTKFLNP